MQPSAAALLVAVLASPATLHAADAHRAVHAKPGEIVLLRTVPTRAATRQAPPGLALIVDTKPNSQLDPALGSMELSDRDAGAISAPVRAATIATEVTVYTIPSGQGWIFVKTEISRTDCSTARPPVPPG